MTALALRAVAAQTVAETVAAGTEKAQGQGHQHVREAGPPAAELPMLVAAVQQEAQQQPSPGIALAPGPSLTCDLQQPAAATHQQESGKGSGGSSSRDPRLLQLSKAIKAEPGDHGPFPLPASRPPLRWRLVSLPAAATATANVPGSSGGIGLASSVDQLLPGSSAGAPAPAAADVAAAAALTPADPAVAPHAGAGAAAAAVGVGSVTPLAQPEKQQQHQKGSAGDGSNGAAQGRQPSAGGQAKLEAEQTQHDVPSHPLQQPRQRQPSRQQHQQQRQQEAAGGRRTG